ncbi:hypothetical protein ACET3Z_013792 [Daucus carota]
MVDKTISFAIEKLGNFLAREVDIRIGVKNGVRWLKDELCYLQSSVRAAEAKQEDELVRLWINNVKDVANEAILILERFNFLKEEHEALKHGILNRLRRFICMCRKESNLYDIGKQIESLKERIVEIKNRREDYGISNILATATVQRGKKALLRATSFENQVDVVGYEEDTKVLLAELVKEDDSLGVISIHGMGGLGKTTLASKLYHSSELSQFETRAWVCFSQAYNFEDVLRTMIMSFDKLAANLSHMKEVDLLRNLQAILQTCDRCLVVIDDMWETEGWEKIKKAFSGTKYGSRVIITTRNKKIAQTVDDRCFVHELHFLSNDESWQLFCKRAKPTKNLEKLGEEMVGKCQGLPLAIVVLSGLLLHKGYQGWLEVHDHIWSQLKGNSVEIQEILNLSYNDLSFQKRKCFLYLAKYPEDFIFDVDMLGHLWIAEEFISEIDERDGLLMEDVAKDYLNELINRNMIQIVDSYCDGRVAACRVHDLVRDLAVQKAKEERLLGIFDSSNNHPSPVHLLREQPRHAIYNGIGNYLKLIGPHPDNSKLRSLATTGKIITGLVGIEIKLISERFKYLKVLDLTSSSSEVIPEEIGNLVLLKYLGVPSCTNLVGALVIPPTIGKLKKLQTLCGLGGNNYDFPSEICELQELRHINFRQKFSAINLMIGSHQTELQTVDSIWYQNWILTDTVHLTNLNSLVMLDASIEENADTLDSIANLTSLQTFILMFFYRAIPTVKPLSFCKRLNDVSLWGIIKHPSDLCFLPDSVTKLKLVNTLFTQDPMPSLGSLSNLMSLYLDCAYLGEKMVCIHDSFPSLRFLTLSKLPSLQELEVEERALPLLKGFQIICCQNLEVVTERVRDVPPLPYDCLF